MTDRDTATHTHARQRIAVALTVVLVLSCVGVAVAAVETPTRTFAFVATGANYPDALAVGPVAGRLNAPLFLTGPGALDEAARDGLLAFDPDVVVIAGGEVALPAAIEDAVVALLPDADVRRVAGGTRTSTARLLADTIREYDAAFAVAGTVGSSMTDADTLDGRDSSAFLGADQAAADLGCSACVSPEELDFTPLEPADLDAVRLARVVPVSASGTPAQNGAALLAALDGIVDATAAKPYVLQLGPGVFDLGSANLVMKDFVDLAGAGQHITRVTCACGTSDFNDAKGTVVGADGTIRDVTVVNQGGAGLIYTMGIEVADAPTRVERSVVMADGPISVFGIVVSGGAGGWIRDVSVSASGGNNFVRGILLSSSAGPVERVRVTAHGANAAGVLVNFMADDTKPAVLQDVVATAATTGPNAYGLRLDVSSVRVTNSQFTAAGGSISSAGMYVANPSTPLTATLEGVQLRGDLSAMHGAVGQSVKVATSRLVGGVTGTFGLLACVHSYDNAHAPLGEQCQGT